MPLPPSDPGTASLLRSAEDLKRKLLDTAIPIRVDAGDRAEAELDIRSTEAAFDRRGGSADSDSSAGGSMIRSFDTRVPHEQKWARPTNQDGTGATHVKTFYCKLRPDAIDHLDSQINTWLDAHPEYEVKQVTSSIGKLVSKRSEDALFLNVWV